VGDFGHDGNLEKGGRTEKFVLTPALNPTFYPGEKEQQSHVFDFSADVRQIPAVDFQVDGERFSFSLGRRSG